MGQGRRVWTRKEEIRDIDYINEYIFRGGSYIHEAHDLRSAARTYIQKQNAPTYNGIRLCIYMRKFPKIYSNEEIE